LRECTGQQCHTRWIGRLLQDAVNETAGHQPSVGQPSPMSFLCQLSRFYDLTEQMILMLKLKGNKSRYIPLDTISGMATSEWLPTSFCELQNPWTDCKTRLKL
jgi:hypothetical protein